VAFCAMLQRTIDFEESAQREPERIAETTSLPPPTAAPLDPSLLVRPDRQLTYGGTSHYEWPPPDRGSDTITVDRIRDDIDGPSHRFVIQRGDAVEVYLVPNRIDIGEVTGISHRNQEVRVSFREESDGVWVAKECVYPTLERRDAEPSIGAEPLSKVIAADNQGPSNGFSERDRTPPPDVAAPYTFDEYKQFRRTFADCSLTYSDYQAQFARLGESQDAIVSELKSRFKATELAVISSRMGSWDARRSTKDENAASIYHKMLASFLLDGTVSYSMGERYEDAVKKKVQAVTLEDFVAAFAERQAKAEEHKKALADPKTFFEFRTFLQEKSEGDLSDEQLARYDALHTDVTRERRASEVKTTVAQFQSEELNGYEFQIKEGFHEKRKCPVWIVQLTGRVERATFNELNIKAKMLGGWYSSFCRANSGFHFLEQDKAERFGALLNGDADRSDVLEARKNRREKTAAERLHELATDLAARADETIEHSNGSLQNTARRADIQVGVRGRAFADQALARTIHSIAEALSRGEAGYISGIRHKTHVETLDTVLYLAKWARVRAAKRSDGESTYSHGTRLDRIEDEPIGPKDVRYAEYPLPQVYKRHLEELVLRCRTMRGVKQAAEKMRKRLFREKDDYVTFTHESDIEALSDFIGRPKSAGLDVERIEQSLEKYNRLQRANITDIHELRAALREYLAHRAEARGDNPVRVAERELVGKKLPGFFPTPPSVIERMLELSEIGPEDVVLEPSCGKGDIIDAMISHVPNVRVRAIERNHALAEVLTAKGHEVEFGDFLEHRGSYDRIVMNPPFEDGADMAHIRHAHSLLKPGGRLVSVISEGPFFRVDNKTVAFRDWLEEVCADVERLPDDAFTGAEAFRETAVRTRLVTISKER